MNQPAGARSSVPAAALSSKRVHAARPHPSQDRRPTPGWGASALLVFLAWLVLSGGLPTAAWCADPAGKTVVWVDSYREDYAWSRGIGEGIRQALEGSGVRLESIHMDTQHSVGGEVLQAAGQRAKELLDALRPDLVIASDDNAQQYLVVPYLLGTELPVVFCGVNARPETYGYPAPNVTGMLEVEPLEALHWHLRRFARGDRVGYLSGDVATDHKVIEKYNQEHYQGRITPFLARDFAEFEVLYRRAQTEVDMLLFMNNGGIEGWEDDRAAAFLARETRIPLGTVAPYLKRFAMITLGKDPLEQGEYAGSTALAVLAGTSPGKLPLARNERVLMTLNLELAEAAGIILPLSTLEAAAEILGGPRQ